MNWIRELDNLLRGERTRDELLVGGRFDLPLRVFIPVGVLLGAIYGFCMGWFSVAAGRPGSGMQLIAATLKFPALFILTLVVTFPSLYVFNALVGTRLHFLAALRLLFAAIVINLAVAASLGPIVVFFTLSTTSYHFMVVLNVLLLGLSGLVALGFLLRTLERLAAVPEVAPAEVAPAEPVADVPPPPPSSPANTIFYIWVVIYGLVGAQMGWLLRPFVGHPGREFQWFRAREGNFFLGLYINLRQLFEQ